MFENIDNDFWGGNRDGETCGRDGRPGRLWTTLFDAHARLAFGHAADDGGLAEAFAAE